MRVLSCEMKIMDEHMILSEGTTVEFKYDLIDNNQKDLEWWTAKHNWYSNREVLDHQMTFVELSKMLPSKYQIILVRVTQEQKSNLPDNIIGLTRTDSVQELAELYTAAFVFVNPTYEDNYSTTNLEALACGTPAITYRTGGSVEAVEKCGSGVVVEQGDVKGILDAIETQQISEKRKKSLFCCDEKVNYEKYYMLYCDILEKNK